MSIQPKLRHVCGARRRRALPRTHLTTVGQCFDIEVRRDPAGWAIRIPEIDADTHARHRAEVSVAARECIATRTGIPIGYIAVIVRD
jgi:hypothetical protein